MPDRLPPVARSSLPESQRPAYDSMVTFTENLFGPPDQSPFIYKRQSDGAFVGPFPLLLEAPEAGEHAMELYGKLAKIPGLPADAREVAILTVGVHFKAAYELYAHTRVATEKAGMDKDVVEAIVAGRKPDVLNEGCSVAFDVAKYLASTPGPLPKTLWDRSIGAFGKTGTVALMHYIGAYAHTCILLNAMDCPVPDED